MHTYMIVALGKTRKFNFIAYAPNQQFDARPIDNTASDTVTFDLPTSIQKPLNNTAFTIFPNPVSQQLHIQTKGQAPIQEILMYDLTGRLQLQAQPYQREWRGDVSALSNGTYWVIIKTVEGLGIQKIVKL